MSSYEEQMKFIHEAKEQDEKRKAQAVKKWQENCQTNNVGYDVETDKQYWDSPYAMENSVATIFWIVIMVVGTIFKDSWMIWVIATFIWWKFITRN